MPSICFPVVYHCGVHSAVMQFLCQFTGEQQCKVIDPLGFNLMQLMWSNLKVYSVYWSVSAR